MELKFAWNISRLVHIWNGIVLIIVCIGLCRTFTVYRRCQDVLNDLGENAMDGEYVLYLMLGGQDVGAIIYCYGFQSGSPKEYLYLTSGGNNNFAYFYENVGSTDACSIKLPREPYPEGGRSEYSMIRLNPTNLTVDITDFSFASRSGTRFIRYATAGDKFASTPNCYPHGAFKIDLTGTPFLVSRLVQWTWQGNFSSGNVSAGRARITDLSYLGCFQDRENRLLSALEMDDDQLMTPQYCMDYCRQFGFRFSGVQFQYECYCGEDFDLADTRSESECRMPCPGDAKQFCGGEWRIRIFFTGTRGVSCAKTKAPNSNPGRPCLPKELVQVVEGHCGGYPGFCFPSLKGDPSNPVFALDIDFIHPCLVSNPCQNEGKCIATTATGFACQCYTGYGGELCEQLNELIVIETESCPQGFQPELCQCDESRCSGAIFRGDQCVTSTNHSRITCRYGNPGYVVLFNVDGVGRSNPSCPSSSIIISCSYWSNSSWQGSNGQGQIRENTCYADGCGDCQKQARCKEYRCGCQNGGICSPVTGKCTCPTAYYGDTCETFDYCRYYEDRVGTSTCDSGGVCTAFPKNTTRTYGGDNAGDYCIFPFEYAGQSFESCIDDNSVGPPFACGGYFQEQNSYIDLGQWSPGPTYTMAAWVKPYMIDNKRRTIVGGVTDCNDWGINLQHFSFRGYVKINASCTVDLDTGGMPPVQVGQWYMVALVDNGTHAMAYLNGALKSTIKVKSYHLPTTSGFRIGGEFCCPENSLNGLIKTIKVWNHALDPVSLNISMYTLGTSESTEEAINNGLVGHWELGEEIPQACVGINHEGVDWTLRDGQIISGIHCEIRRFYVPKGVNVTIQRYTGSSGGKVAIFAQEILIDGYIDGVGAGYRGGRSPGGSGATGIQGETYNGGGIASNLGNKGGGGGGIGSAARVDVTGQPGGGGGYGTAGSPGIRTSGDRSGTGSGGRVYGDQTLSVMYMGSGGGSGGNPIDLISNPRGGRGGNGGGAIRLVASKSVVITGVISVAGENGQGDVLPGPGCLGCPQSCSINNPTQCSGNRTDRCWDLSGPGGGGSGGTIYISAKLVNVGYQRVRATGGMGGGGVNGRCGGTGGMGRIKVDSDVFKGNIGPDHGAFYQQILTNTFIDHSQVGQSQIDYRTTVYGNEVYRGCFEERSINDRLISQQIQLSDVDAARMTPQLCQKLCRQRGFMFSGTQFARECFCDNQLEMSRKRPDSECNTPCLGDIQQTCGGANRIQVLGPPPAVPGTGYNLYPKCEEWCVTANANSAKPKWGNCDTSSPAETVYQINCNCFPGFMGSRCEQPCPSGRWGINCNNTCTCIQTNTDVCSPTDGACQCKPGFTGGNCENICRDGFYGRNCLSRCNCVHSASCDHFTGICDCLPGWFGASCRFPCPQGTFGKNCANVCNCNHGVCSPEDGTCFCDNGYKLPNCSQKCEAFKWGANCSNDCDCNGLPCNFASGICQCGPGYTGNKCEFICPSGTWGQGCRQRCGCMNGFDCNHVTGMCKCGYAYTGAVCDVPCLKWSFGSLCTYGCPCIEARATGCDAFSGQCVCKPGYQGFGCEKECNPGYYGQNCTSFCNCQHGATCNPENGLCRCALGFYGDECELPCPDNFYGPDCNRACVCSSGICNKLNGTCICQSEGICPCPDGFFGSICEYTCECRHGRCTGTTGRCICNSGWTGTNCDKPCVGFYGPNCQNRCNCSNGICDPVTGYCKCHSGYYGSACENRCNGSLGAWGPQCAWPCPICGTYAKPGCDAATGVCVCNTGFAGPLCDKPCPFGTYGVNCERECNCPNGSYCDSVLGTCTCKAGFMGQNCSMVCPRNRWGPNCTYRCDCGPNGDSCTTGEGICVCKPGFTGAMCQGSCGRGLYGFHCTHVCQCDPRTSTCNPVDGTCECNQGYTGEHCDQTNV